MSLLQITCTGHSCLYTILFQHFKTCSQEDSKSWVISTPGIHSGTSTSMHICHDIITSILCSKTFWLVSWLYYCFTAVRYILGNFKRSQLAYPHCSWASLLGSLPVLSAHSFAINWQLPFLNQQKGGMVKEFVSWPNLHERMCRARGSNPRPSAYQAVRASNWASTPGLKGI